MASSVISMPSPPVLPSSCTSPVPQDDAMTPALVPIIEELDNQITSAFSPHNTISRDVSLEDIRLALLESVQSQSGLHTEDQQQQDNHPGMQLEQQEHHQYQQNAQQHQQHDN
jgi:hypothetical protein